MKAFESNVISIYGEKGKVWLAQLPELVDHISLRWDLRDLKPVSNLTYHYVLTGFQDDVPVILKLGLDNEGLKKEAFALQCFAGYGAVNVITAEDGLLLLERAIPGTPLKSYFSNKDIDAIAITCHVMKKLHQAAMPKDHNFPHIKDWLAALDKDWNIPVNYLQRARVLRAQLLASSDPNVLLHGDLHHDNILQNGDGWVVIDPKGVIGSPINEIWALVMDMERDIEFIANFFKFNLQDVWDWYFVHLILAACWNLEDHIDAKLFMELAEKAYPMTSE